MCGIATSHPVHFICVSGYETVAAEHELEDDCVPMYVGVCVSGAAG